MKVRMRSRVLLMSLGSWLLANSLLAQDFPDNLDFIILADLSGSMEFTLDGNYPVPTGQLRRIDYVIPGLEALAVVFQRLLEVDIGVSGRRYAIGSFPGRSIVVNGGDPPPSAFTWLPLSGTSDLRNYSETELLSIVAGLDITWFGTPLATAVLAAIQELNDPANDLGDGVTNGEIILLFTDGKKREAERIYNVDSGGSELPSGTGISHVRNEIKLHIDHPSRTDDNDRIKILSLGFGDLSTASAETDFQMLNDISLHLGQYNSAGDMSAIFTKDVISVAFSTSGYSSTPVTLDDPNFLINPGSIQEHRTYVTQYDQKLLFMVSWNEPKTQGTIQFSVRSAADTVLTPALAERHPQIDFDSGRTFQLYTVRQPFLQNNIGEWQLIINGEGIERPEWYAFSVLGSSRLQLRDVTPNADTPKFPGDVLKLSVSLTADSNAISDAVVNATITGPAAGAGNWFAEFPLTPDQLDSVRNIEFPGQVEDVYKKFLYMHHLNNVALPGVDTSRIQLNYDEADSLYHGETQQLVRPGIYKVEVSASHASTETSQFFKRGSIQHYHLAVKPNLDWTHSALVFTKVQESPAFDLFQVKFTPKDQFDNFVKPGKGDHLKFRLENATKTNDPIVDDLAGSYTTTVSVPKNALRPTVEVQFDNLVFKQRNITVNPIGDNWRFRPGALTFRLGPAIPLGASSTPYDPMIHFSVDFNRQINRNWAWLVNSGFAQFSGQGGTSDLTYWNISANARWLPIVTPEYRMFINAGAGIYIPDEGSSNAGVNIGAGLLIPLSTMLDLELGGDYKDIIKSGSDFRFSNIYVGLAVRF